MNNLLSTVKGAEGVPGRASAGAALTFDIEAGYTAAQSERTAEMNTFFARVDELKADLQAIRAKQREVQAMHERSKSIVRPREMQTARDEMQASPPPASSRRHSCMSYQAHTAVCMCTNLHVLPFPSSKACSTLPPHHTQAVINEVNVLAHKAKGKIELIDKLNAAALQKKGQGVGSASERTRTSVTAGAGLYRCHTCGAWCICMCTTAC